MKKLLLLVAAFICFHVSHAQDTKSDKGKNKTSSVIKEKKRRTPSKLYIRGGLGYAARYGSQVYGLYGYPISGNDNYGSNGAVSTNTFKHNNASMISGLQGQIGVGYMFSDHVGVDLAAYVCTAPKYNYTANNKQVLDTLVANVSVSQYAMSPVFLTPSLVLQSGGKKVNVYTRAGLVLPISTTVHFREQDHYVGKSPFSSHPDEVDITVVEVKSKFSLGFTGALGVSYALNERFKIWAEGCLLSETLYPDQKTIKSYTQNGKNLTGKLSSTSSNYATGGTNVNANTIALSSTDVPTTALPFSNIGLNVGLTFNLSAPRLTY